MASIYKCPPLVEANWHEVPPYIYRTNEITGIFPQVIDLLLYECCGGKTNISYVDNFYGNGDVEHMILNATTDIVFPVFGDVKQNRYLGNLYLPIIQSQGVAFYARQYMSTKQVVLEALYEAWPLLVLVCILSMVTGGIFWLVELRTFNPRGNTSYIKHILIRLRQLIAGCYWAIVSGATVGYGDVYPQSTIGRVVAVFWIIAGTISMSMFTASITSVLVSVCNEKEITINGATMGTLLNSAEYKLGRRLNANVKAFDDVHSMVKELSDRSIDGVLIDTYIAGHFQELFSESRLQDVLDYPTTYGMALARNGVNLGLCLEKEIEKHQDVIMRLTSKGFKPLKIPKHSLSEEKSSTLFNVRSPALRNFLMTVGTVILSVFVIGIIWDTMWRQKKIRQSHKDTIEADSNIPLSALQYRQEKERIILYKKIEEEMLSIDRFVTMKMNELCKCNETTGNENNEL